jgi:hypothetical protein
MASYLKDVSPDEKTSNLTTKEGETTNEKL